MPKLSFASLGAPARSSGIAFLLAVVGWLAAPYSAQAQSTSANVYRACYVPTTGTVYRIGDTGQPTSCAKSTHVEFTWNSEGPPGPVGPPGEKGAQGDKEIGRAHV